MIKSVVLISFLIAFAAILCKVIWLLDINKRVYNHRPGKCQRVEGPVHGAEDIAHVESEGIAFVTSGIYFMGAHPDAVGKIFLYDFKNAASKYLTRELEIKNKPQGFHPHGLSAYIDNGQILLYVVAHSKTYKEHSVEVFEFDRENQILTHIKSIHDPSLIRPNDLFVVGKDRFFFTNDGSAQSMFAMVFEMFFALPTGSVGYFDGQKTHWLVKSDVSPNGIWVDVKKGILFYASHLGEFIKVMRLSEDFKTAAEHLVTVDLLTSPDNIHMDSEGVLWAGCHPVWKDMVSSEGACRLDPPGKASPSQVLRIRFSNDYRFYEISEPFADDGRLLACSTIAVPDGKGSLLIGTIGTALLHCEIDQETI